MIKKIMLSILAMFLFMGVAFSDDTTVTEPVTVTETTKTVITVDEGLSVKLHEWLNKENTPYLDKLPALDNGIVYSLVEHKLSYAGTFKVANLTKNKKLSLNAGYYAKDGALASVNYDFGTLEDLDVKIFLVDKIHLNAGGFFGAKRFEDFDITKANTDYGASLLGIIKFEF